MNDNPYDLVSITINGQPTTGRPFEFDSEITDILTLKNAFGHQIRPTKLSSVCPDCGQGLEIPIKLEPVIYRCPYCYPPAPPMEDPFLNPLKSKLITETQLDQLATVTITPAPTESVAQRVVPVVVARPEPAQPFKLTPTPHIIPEPPIDFTPEVELDDDLVELE